MVIIVAFDAWNTTYTHSVCPDMFYCITTIHSTMVCDKSNLCHTIYPRNWFVYTC